MEMLSSFICDKHELCLVVIKLNYYYIILIINITGASSYCYS